MTLSRFQKRPIGGAGRSWQTFRRPNWEAAGGPKVSVAAELAVVVTLIFTAVPVTAAIAL